MKRPAPGANAEPEAPPLPLGEKILRAAIALPLLLAGLVLVFLGAASQLGALGAVPGFLCIGAALGVLVSRSPGATVFSIAAAGTLYLLLFGALHFLNAAIYSR